MTSPAPVDDRHVQGRSLRRWFVVALPLVAGLAALRAAFLLVELELRTGGVQRFRVEAAGLLFIILALVARALLPSVPTVVRGRSIGVPNLLVAVGAIAVALLAYRSAFHVGLLSDDWVLVLRARSGHFGPVSSGLFRPLPLLVWALLLKIGAGVAALHGVNVVLHGLNSFLVYRIVAGWIHDERGSLAAGLLFLLTPLAVEPVTWCSGVFDVSMLFFCLCAVLIARHAQDSMRAFGLACGCAVLAILCKESAVVLPGLLIVDAAIRRAATRRVAALVLAVGSLSVAYAGVRLVLAFGVAHPPTSKYVLQRALFNTFGALSIPLPSSVSTVWFVVAGILVVVLSAHLLLSNTNRFNSRPLLLAAWVLACVVPVYPILFVSSNLEGSRYLYESMVGWSALLACAGWTGSSVFRVCGMLALCILLAIDVVGLRRQLHAWQSAAALRDSVLMAARSDDRMTRCQAVTVTNLPDSVLGAYVLRNGGAELLRSVGIIVGTPTHGCHFGWSNARQQFIPFN